MNVDRVNTSEKVVSIIFAVWSAYPILLLLLIMWGISLPSPFMWLFYPFYLSLFVSWLYFTAIPFGFFSATLVPAFLVGEVVLFFLYPLTSYYLWYGYRVAWVLALAVSLLTVAVDVYLALVTISSLALAGIAFSPFIWGLAFNLFVLYLLWRRRGHFEHFSKDDV